MSARPAEDSPGALPIHSDGDVVRVRQRVRQAAEDAGLSLVEQTKLVTAASELARNSLVYAAGGTASVQVVTVGHRAGVRAVFVDHGPGIADVAMALTDGWSSGLGLGLGLPGARRLVDDFDLRTEETTGTVVTIVKWAGR